jgi:hypothetical protein
MFSIFKSKIKPSPLDLEVGFLRHRIDLLASICEKLETRIERLEAARWGLKVDGTAKAKPGRKVKNERIS